MIVPRITDATGASFAPALKLKLTALALTTDGALVVQDAASAPTKVRVPQVLQFAGRDVIKVSTARVASAVLILGAMLAAAAFVFAIRRGRQPSEADLIRRRYRKLLVEIEPMQPPPGRPVVGVTEFKTLARLAERYGLLVLHWSTAPSRTFAVQDDTATYWYCTDSGTDPGSGPTLTYRAEHADRTGDVTEIPPHSPDPLSGDQDPLTNLASQSLFEGAVQVALDTGDARLCLLMIDIDDFSTINETHGRAAGDAVLVTIAERLRRTVRPRDLVARLSGDNFAVLFENVGPAEVNHIAKRVMRNVNESVSVQGQQVRVRASLGIAQSDEFVTAHTLMQHATAALAGAKAATDEHLAWFATVTEPGSE
jgi:diguanylate cyclase (GGDEF)-like protein